MRIFSTTQVDAYGPRISIDRVGDLKLMSFIMGQLEIRSTHGTNGVEDTVSDIVAIQRRDKFSFMLDRFSRIAVFISELLETLLLLGHSNCRYRHHAKFFYYKSQGLGFKS